MYARDPSLLLSQQPGYSNTPTRKHLRQKGVGDLSSRLPSPIKTSQNQW
jgi:hypothetical protein